MPARLDQLPWTRTHSLIVAALGVTWVLDGLEVTLKGAMSGVLQDPRTLHFTTAEIGLVASCYLAGAVIGALLFGHLTDRLGRKRLVFVTLGVYLSGALLTAFSWDLASFIVFRVVTGMGIGGEYAAINSAIDELIPARVRGRVDLYINGSYWIGAAFGALATVWLLDPAVLPVDVGWRLGFGIGAVLGLIIILVRRFIPESPRWLIMHGRAAEAEAIVASIEREAAGETGRAVDPPPASAAILIRPHRGLTFRAILSVLLHRYPRRTALGLALMIAQAFLYNAVFFTYALVLTNFYAVPAGETGLYLLPFAIANVVGVVTLGALFDTVGRRVMITATYAIAALLLVLTGFLFVGGHLTAATQTALWTAIFFFASPAASAAYLTVSEVFPLEMRAMAIAIFFAIGTGAGGVVAPWVFGVLIGTGERVHVAYGYAFAAALMLAAAAIEAAIGVDAERRGLEDIAPPLSKT